MYENTTARMLLTTAVLAAVAALLAGPANAYVMDVEGGGGSGAAVATAAPIEPGSIPYLSQGIGVDESLFGGTGLTYETQAPANESLFQGEASQPSLGLTGDSPLTRVSAPEPEGLTGDGALTRYPGTGRGLTAAASSGNDTDWTWFGLGAGMAALVAAGLAGVLLTARHRGRIALP